MSNITGQLVSVDSTGVPGSVEVQLCGYGSQIPIVGLNPGGKLNTKATCDATGHFTFTIRGNDVIVPNGTYYTITSHDDNGDIMQCNAYMFADATNYDLGSAATIVPPQPLPPGIPLGLLVVPYAATLLFDGRQANGFKVVLTGNLYATVTNMRDKCLVPFTFRQDAVGGHVVTWSSDAHNAGSVHPDANWTTVQVFATDSDGTLNGVGSVAYTAPF
jgi:hypothetical protein